MLDRQRMRVALSLALIFCLAGTAFGQTVSSLKADYETAQKNYGEDFQKQVAAAVAAHDKAVKEAKTDEDRKKIRWPGFQMFDPLGGPATIYRGRFLEFAKQHPKDASVVESLVMAVQLCGDEYRAPDTWKDSLDLLRTGYAERDGLRPLIKMLVRSSDDATIGFLREVEAHNPDRKTRAMALRTLAEACQGAADSGDALQKDEAGQRKWVEKAIGKERVERLIAKQAEFAKVAADARGTLRRRYSDVLPDLSVGQPAPEVICHDLNGKPVRLSSLKGQVVVLDIWATWCGPCKAMIPHEREMVQRLRGKPFTLVSISADEKKATLQEFLKTEPMPWTHWWNGRSGGILEDWDVQFFPTTYVIDAKGIIRFKDLRDAELEKAVVGLLSR